MSGGGGGDFPLNDRQQQAVNHVDGPMLVLAGAGTGKTRVLVARVAKLIERGVPSHRVLAVTFTNKAADEMRERLRGLFGEVADAMWIGTFHATCARLLRRYGEAVGLSRDFSILDDADQGRIVRRILKAEGLDAKVSAAAILARIDHAKNRGVNPVSVDDSFAEAMGRVYPAYVSELARTHAVDFNDLILRTIDLMGTEPVGSLVSSKFDHVLVDEFQDTNLVQYTLVRALARRTSNLFAVGDDDQSIYAWRGAEPGNLRGLEAGDLGRRARLVKLEENYRSTQVVLDAANGVIDQGEGRHKKVLWTRKKGGDRVEIHCANDDRGEARFVVRRISDLLRGGTRASDIAVLFRTNAQARILEEQLRFARVGARIVGATSFFEREEVKDVLSYLKIAAHPALDSAFERAIGAPARGVGDKTLLTIRAKAKSDGVPMLEAARAAARGSLPGVGKRQALAIASFLGLVDSLAADARDGRPIVRLVSRASEESGIRSGLEMDAESGDRLGNLDEMLVMASDFDDEIRAAVPRVSSGGVGGGGEPARGDADTSFPPEEGGEGDVFEIADRLVAFIERAALVQPDDVDPGTRGGARWGSRPVEDAVSLMTVHVAKGLEWPVVFVVGLEDGLFPSLRDRDGLADNYDGLGEERRLMYVAITRARSRLVLSHARSRRIWGEILSRESSRFLDDLPPGCWDAVDESGRVISSCAALSPSVPSSQVSGAPLLVG
jgi:DNA helicase-2/ATP-dependent DNA helicase PcrA